jgi:osmotically-inducible protein OsmY
MKSLIIHSLVLSVLALCLFSLACQQQDVDDATLTAKIKTKLIADGRVSPTRVSVETAAGIVTLKGTVPTQVEKTAAEQVARTVEGVKEVRNEVTVDPAAAGTGAPPVNEIKSRAKEAVGEARTKVDHTVLLGKVKTRLVAAGYSEVSVEIKQDEATLTGEVENNKDRIAAERIVERVDGIKKVHNRLKTKRR